MKNTGHGQSHGALTVVNAISCGFGAAFGISLETRASVRICDEPGFSLQINGRDADASFASRLIRSVVPDAAGAQIETVSNIPVSHGLKSSSAAANAILLAACDAAGIQMTADEILARNTSSSVQAGVSITGAFDDAAACLLGGLVCTDNTANKILKRMPMPIDLSVIIHLPEFEVYKPSFPKEKLWEKRAVVEKIFADAMSGDIFSAMYRNGAVTASALGISTKTADIALALGAKAAGISGTGPATGILVSTSDVDDFLSVFDEKNVICGKIWNGD